MRRRRGAGGDIFPYPCPWTYPKVLALEERLIEAIATTHHFFFCFFAPVFAGAMVNVDVWKYQDVVVQVLSFLQVQIALPRL